MRDVLNFAPLSNPLAHILPPPTPTTRDIAPVLFVYNHLAHRFALALCFVASDRKMLVLFPYYYQPMEYLPACDAGSLLYPTITPRSYACIPVHGSMVVTAFLDGKSISFNTLFASRLVRNRPRLMPDV